MSAPIIPGEINAVAGASLTFPSLGSFRWEFAGAMYIDKRKQLGDTAATTLQAM